MPYFSPLTNRVIWSNTTLKQREKNFICLEQSTLLKIFWKHQQIKGNHSYTWEQTELLHQSTREQCMLNTQYYVLVQHCRCQFTLELISPQHSHSWSPLDPRPSLAHNLICRTGGSRWWRWTGTLTSQACSPTLLPQASYAFHINTCCYELTPLRNCNLRQRDLLLDTAG